MVQKITSLNKLTESKVLEYEKLSAESARKLFSEYGINPNETKLFGITDSTKNPFNVIAYFSNFRMTVIPNCNSAEINVVGEYYISRQFDALSKDRAKPSVLASPASFKFHKIIPYKIR